MKVIGKWGMLCCVGLMKCIAVNAIPNEVTDSEFSECFRFTRHAEATEIEQEVQVSGKVGENDEPLWVQSGTSEFWQIGYKLPTKKGDKISIDFLDYAPLHREKIPEIIATVDLMRLNNGNLEKVRQTMEYRTTERVYVSNRDENIYILYTLLSLYQPLDGKDYQIEIVKESEDNMGEVSEDNAVKVVLSDGNKRVVVYDVRGNVMYEGLWRNFEGKGVFVVKCDEEIFKVKRI